MFKTTDSFLILQSLRHLNCYIHNVSVDMSSGLLQEFLAELEYLHEASNYVPYIIHGDRLFWFRYYNKVRVLSIPVLLLTCSQDWTWNLQKIVA